MKFKTLADNKYFYLTIFILIVLAFLCISLFFILKDSGRPSGDEAKKLILALGYYNNFLGNTKVSYHNEFYTPLYFLLPAFICFLFKYFSYKICASFNLFYYLITAASTYLLTLKIIKNRATALLAVLVVSFLNFYFLTFLHLFVMEVGLTAFVCLSIFLLIKTDYFKNPLYSILFGISSGIGMLMKWTFAIYILGPLLVYMVYTFKELTKDDEKQKINRSRNILYAFSLILGLFVIWAIRFLDLNGFIQRYINTFRYEADFSQCFFPHILFFKYVLFLFMPTSVYSSLINNYFCLAILILSTLIPSLIIFTFYSFITNAERKNMYLILAYFFVPAAILSLIVPNAQPRYILPLLPAQAIIIACGLSYIKGKLLKKVMLATTIFVLFYSLISNILYLSTTIEKYHPVEKALLEIDKDTAALKTKTTNLVIVYASEDTLNDVLKYFIILHHLDLDYLDLRQYIRRGKIIKELDPEILSKINSVKYLVSDFYPLTDFPLLKKIPMPKNNLHVLNRFFYQDYLVKYPLRYMPLLGLNASISIYKTGK
ncbi:MAG: hypothetical protein PHH69_00240 [Candidatus Omnitrophica bacterium]|nr:hypothetical protein [Candidatus Omnitrophota bacterium]